MGQLEPYLDIDYQIIQDKSYKLKDKALTQLVEILNSTANLQTTGLIFGDEVEYLTVNLNPLLKKVTPNFQGYKLLERLNRSGKDSSFQPEFCRFMVEGIPSQPYDHDITSLLGVELNLINRRKSIQSSLKSNQKVMTISHLPNLTGKQMKKNQSVTPLPRYFILNQNLIRRRNHPLNFKLPIYKDIYTKQESIPIEGSSYGLSSCSLQVTFQFSNQIEARYVYDQLVPLTALLLSLTVSSSIVNSKLSGFDGRWDLLNLSLDERTKEELDPKHLKFKKSGRGGNTLLYISNCKLFKPEYNDMEVSVDTNCLQTLLQNNIDFPLARYFSNTLNFDPLLVTQLMFNLKKDVHNHCLESYLSTNWQPLRFKLPNQTASLGYRVEVRPMEVQLTDLENSSFILFLNLLVRCIIHFQLNFYLPISKVHTNFSKATSIDSCTSQKFWFNTNVFQMELCKPKLFSLNELVNGNLEFVGFLPLIHRYLQEIKVDLYTRRKLDRYLDLIKRRANGSLPTGATFCRQFVLNHKAYKKDSIVNENIVYDLFRKIDMLNKDNIKTKNKDQSKNKNRWGWGNWV